EIMTQGRREVELVKERAAIFPDQRRGDALLWIKLAGIENARRRQLPEGLIDHVIAERQLMLGVQKVRRVEAPADLVGALVTLLGNRQIHHARIVDIVA